MLISQLWFSVKKDDWEGNTLILEFPEDVYSNKTVAQYNLGQSYIVVTFHDLIKRVIVDNIRGFNSADSADSARKE